MGNDYLFVYGTLRKAYGLELMQVLNPLIHHIGQGVVSAALYDLGPYPAAVKEGRQKALIGDVYQIKDVEAVFALLDEYEREEYQRETTNVLVDTGKNIDAFMYWYTGDIENALRVEEVDYLDYLKNKKTVNYKWNITP